MINKEKVLAIIPARGGSKRLPGKNMKSFNGKPLIYWTMNAAKKSKYIDDIYISTDSLEIADYGKKIVGEKVELRPNGLATDDSSIVDTISYILEEIGDEYSWGVLLQPTSPLRDHNDIDNCISKTIVNKYKSSIAVTKFEKSLGWLYEINEGKLLEKRIEGSDKMAYLPNGAIYLFRIDWFNNVKKLNDKNTLAYEMLAEKSVDIDNELEFETAEFYMKRRKIKIVKKGWTHLKKHLDKERFTVQDMVPVLGSGFNAQMQCSNVFSTSWYALLEEVRKQKKIKNKKLCGHATIDWENMSMCLAEKDDYSMQANKYQKCLLEAVQGILAYGEYKNSASLENFKEIEFANILSLNFDLFLQNNTNAKIVPTKNYKDYLGKYTRNLYVKYKLDNSFIWNLNGSTRCSESMFLGVYEYGNYISEINNAINYYKSKQKKYLRGNKQEYFCEKGPFSEWQQQLSADRNPSNNWVEKFMAYPLLFLGCGLSPEEWWLWWIVNQKTRDTIRSDAYKFCPIYVLWKPTQENEAVTSLLRSRSNHIHLLEVDDWRDGWNKLLQILL